MRIDREEEINNNKDKQREGKEYRRALYLIVV